MNDKYALADGNVVPCPDLTEWAKTFEGTSRIIGKDELPGGVLISTVFLGIDHRFAGEGPPIVFETIVFGGPLDREQERYCTMEEAKVGHGAMVARARAHDANQKEKA